jgi:hypothetical protein
MPHRSPKRGVVAVPNATTTTHTVFAPISTITRKGTWETRPSHLAATPRRVSASSANMSEGNYALSASPSLSLVSQLNGGAFSYCLIQDTSKASSLLFDFLATMTGVSVQSTRLLNSGTFSFVGKV